MIISRGVGSTKRRAESRTVIRMGRVPKLHLRAKKKKKITFVSTSTCSQSDEAQQAEGGGEGR